MKRFLLVSFLITSICSVVSGQTTVFSDNFNTSTGATYTGSAGPIGSSGTWFLSRNAADWGARIDNNILDLTNDASAAGNANGWVFGYTPTSFFTAPYNTTLSSNTSLVTWTFNMRQIRPDPAGFNTTSSYGAAFILGSTSSTPNTAGNGYAVVLGNTTATDPIRLTKFTGGITSLSTTAPPSANDIIVSNTSGLADFGAEYLSIKVTYDPTTNTWQLFVRNDGTTAFSDPAAGILTSQGTAVDATYTGSLLSFMGGYWQGSTAGTQTAFFDNVSVAVGVVSNTITVGILSTAIFNIDCFTDGTGTVDFTSSGTFNSGNNYVAQLSDGSGSFASFTVVGSLASTANIGQIPITIPAGTPSGAGYLIRIVSTNPSITSGNNSATITVSLSGLCTSSTSDYFRSKQSGDWNVTSTWQTSSTGLPGSWINSTLTPTSAANTIEIRNTHTVNITGSATADQVIIENGAVLNHTGGTITVDDGAGDDIDIQNGGVFTLAFASTLPAFNGTANVNVGTGGILRISAAGLTTGVNVSNFVYQHQSILEYTLSGAFTTGGLVYFPNVNATTIPIFRTTVNSPTVMSVGAGTATTFNGVFEISGTGTIRWQNGGDKIFRNGIRGVGNMDYNAATIATAKFIINGVTAEIGGAGSLSVPPSSLEIGSALNATTVSVTAAKTITGDITLLSANNTYIDLGANNLTVTGVINGGTTNAFVRTNGGGGLLTLNAITTNKTFPIGETTYNPLVISTGSGNNFSARVRTGIFDPNGAIPTDAVNRTWYIMANNVTPAVNVTYQYSSTAGELTGAAATHATTMELLQSDFTTWHLSGGNSAIAEAGADPYTVTTAAGIAINNTIVPYAVGVTGTKFLAIDCIITTRAQKRNNTGIISWNINSCADVTSFEVQRLVNNGFYQTIGTVSPSNNQTDFSFTDPSLTKGTNLYRVKVNRLAGLIKYSNTVALIYESDAVLITSVVPNPVHTSAILTLSAAKQGSADFKVYNMTGHLVRQWHSKFAEGNNIIEMNADDLPSGIYQVLVSTANSKTVTRFVKQ